MLGHMANLIFYKKANCCKWMYVSPATTYNELVNAMNNNNNKRYTNTADVSIHVFLVLLKINIKILAL